MLDWLSYVVGIRVRDPIEVELKGSKLNLRNSLHLNTEETHNFLEKFNTNSPKWLERTLTGNRVLIPADNKSYYNNNRGPHKFEGSETLIDKLDVLINRLHSMDDEDTVRTEWRVVAMTIDRCLLAFFTLVFFLTVIGCFSYAPGYVS